MIGVNYYKFNDVLILRIGEKHIYTFRRWIADFDILEKYGLSLRVFGRHETLICTTECLKKGVFTEGHFEVADIETKLG